MAQICETCKKKNDRCYCAPNSTCEAYEPEINMNPKNPQVEKILSIDIAVAPTYSEYVPKEYRMPDFVPPIEITCDTKNPYTIKCSSDCKQTENN